MDFKYIKVEKLLKEKIAIITIDREDVYNALSTNLLNELSLAVSSFDEDDEIGAMVLTGGNKVFAAGADIKELANVNFATAYNSGFAFKEWKALQNHQKPIIASVSGYAIGGGCELALLCDIILCDESAMFGQPEVKIGVMPGAGGTQRLTKAVGKSKAMQLCLTGEFMDAKEAKSYHIVADIIKEDVLKEAIRLATKIASMSYTVVRMIKESIDNSYESTLSNGLEQERKSFYSTLALEDKKEGMNAFINKTKPNFTNK